MRARNIKPGFFKNETLSSMPFETRLLFIGLWLIADREGRLEDRPRRIKAELFAYDSIDVESMLNRLRDDEFIIRYSVGGANFIQISNFVKHQDPHYREKASCIPAPQGMENQIKAGGITRTQRARILERDGYKCQECGATEFLCIDHILPVSRGGTSDDENLQVLCLPCNTKKGNKLSGEQFNSYKPNNSGRKTKFNSVQGRVDVDSKQEPVVSLIPDSLIPDSLIPDSLRTPPTPPAGGVGLAIPKNGKLSKTQQALFDAFWQAYPKKRSKGDAEKAWKGIDASEQLLATMVATIERAKTSKEWKKNGGEFIPHPGTWLRARRWEDEEIGTQGGEFDPAKYTGTNPADIDWLKD